MKYGQNLMFINHSFIFAMYTSSILLLLSWPVVIVICWLAVRFALNYYESKQEKTGET